MQSSENDKRSRKNIGTDEMKKGKDPMKQIFWKTKNADMEQKALLGILSHPRLNTDITLQHTSNGNKKDLPSLM